MTRRVTTLPVIEKTVCTTNADRNRMAINRIVIHTMVGTAISADARFNNCQAKVSAHYGVLETGEIWHWVDEDWVAYHAGNYAFNQCSIGIEHEDNGDYNGTRPDTLYDSSSKLVADICKFYGIPCDRQHILKHSEIVATGCPDALDIDRIVSQASLILNPPASVIINDPQQKIDCGPDFGIMELQAVVSTLNDKARSIKDLQQRLTDCQNTPHAPVMPPDNPPVTKPANILTRLLNWLNSLFTESVK